MGRVKLNYEEGSFFAVPFKEGGYGVGIAARIAPGGGVLLGYFFGRRFDALPVLAEVKDWQPKDAITVQRFGDLGLTKGDWPVLGKPGDWDRAKWPIPKFKRYCAHTGRTELVVYTDDNPNSNPLWIRSTEEEIAGLETGNLHGYGAMATVLSKLLSRAGE